MVIIDALVFVVRISWTYQKPLHMISESSLHNVKFIPAKTEEKLQLVYILSCKITSLEKTNSLFN